MCVGGSKRKEKHIYKIIEKHLLYLNWNVYILLKNKSNLLVP